MQLGMIGLGKMGHQLSLNLLDKDHQVVAHDINEDALMAIAKQGADTAASIAELVSKLSKPRTIWIMVSVGDATENVFTALLDHVEPGDRIIDGGNATIRNPYLEGNAVKKKAFTSLIVEQAVA